MPAPSYDYYTAPLPVAPSPITYFESDRNEIYEPTARGVEDNTYLFEFIGNFNRITYEPPTPRIPLIVLLFPSEGDTFPPRIYESIISDSVSSSLF